MPMPPFIEQHGNPQLPPPYRFKAVRVRSFTLQADMDQLMKFCNTHLNFGRDFAVALEQDGTAYLPWAPLVTLEVLSYPEMRSNYDYLGDPTFRNEGFMRQHELYFRLWIAKWEKAGLIALPIEFPIYIPYIFVNNPWSVIAGREVVGYPKVLASFTNLTYDSETFPITMTTDVFRSYNLSEEQTLNEVVVKIEIPDPLDIPGIPAQDIVWPWVLPWGIIDITELDSVLLTMLVGLMGSVPVPTIQKKQIRDAETASGACHQSLIRGELDLKIARVETLPRAKITIPEFTSLRIADDLGLSKSSPNDSLLQFALVWDQLDLGNLTNVLIRSPVVP